MIENGLGRNLLHLAGRHYVMLIAAEKAFSVMKIASSIGPDILILHRFLDHWRRIDSSRFDTIVDY